VLVLALLLRWCLVGVWRWCLVGGMAGWSGLWLNLHGLLAGLPAPIGNTRLASIAGRIGWRLTIGADWLHHAHNSANHYQTTNHNNNLTTENTARIHN